MNPDFCSNWWRFSEYVLDGSHIRPAAGATLERYDPWEAFEASAAKQRGGRMLARPYPSLIQLADSSAVGTERGKGSRSKEMSAPLEWCRQHGLLGLLLVDILQVTLYPRWEIPSPTDQDPWPTSRTYIRTPTQWIEGGDTVATLEARLLLPEQRKNGGLVSREFWDPTWEEPGVLIQDPATGKFRRRKLEETFADFFPSVPAADRETYLYPMPMSENFWKLYSEDVNQFLDWARRFAGIVRKIAEHRAGRHVAEEDSAAVSDAVVRLQILAGHPITTVGGSRNEAFQLRWAPPPLISCYASMVLWDATQGLLNVCDECGSVFVSSAGRARFCSARCRKTSLQREWRVRKVQPQDGEDSGDSVDLPELH